MITLHTILYEGNFREFMTEDCWFFKYTSKHITKKSLTINNLSSINEFNELVAKLRINHEFDVVFVSDYEQEALEFFKLEMTSSSIGYYYSIPYFVAILTIKTPFMFNVSSDCCSDIKVNDEYFEKSIELLTSNNKYPTTTLPWGEHWSVTGVPPVVPPEVTCVGEWEQMNAFGYSDKKQLDDFWCSDVFSDQVFIGHIAKLKEAEYNIKGYAVHYNGPPYGGTNAFEARLSEYLAYNGLFRLIFKNKELYYKHTG